MSKGSAFRKWSRIIHRDVSYLFAGMILIYALSGILMNHRGNLNPHYSVEVQEFKVSLDLTDKEKIDKALVLDILQPLDEGENYTKHYFQKDGRMKVFLKGGSSLQANIVTGHVVYESLARRPLISTMTTLHYNPGKWWTWFGDAFALSLVIITLTGIFMLKGKKGLWGKGGIELLVGMLIPVLLILFIK